MQDQSMVLARNPGMLQISCNLITAFQHCLTSIYCIERNGAINNEPVSAFVYLCQALSAGTCLGRDRSPLSPVCSPQAEVCSHACSQVWVGGRLATPSSLMWTERLRGIEFGVFLAFHVCSLLTWGNCCVLSITCLQLSSTWVLINKLLPTEMFWFSCIKFFCQCNTTRN